MAFQGYTAGSDDAIKVFVRVRPANSSESQFSRCVRVEKADNAVILTTQPDSKVFTYDSVADSDATQEQVFTTVGKPICESCVAGYNGTVFAYGQTGAGKTFTMQGPIDEVSNNREQRGLIQRMFEYIFTCISREEKKSGGNKKFLCKASFLEIFNENIYDLSDATGLSRSLNLREDIKTGVFVDGLNEKTVSSPEECSEVLLNGARNRHIGATNMNRESSRSHSVFTLVVQSKETVGTVSHVRVSCLNLVDLAGSERQKLTDAAGDRLKEAGKINKSLSALGNVIMSLVDVTNGKTRHVAYRDSKLTFLLRDSLGGNTKTWIIANVSPVDKCFGETLSTLKFASRAKMIVNTAKINEDAQGNVEGLQEEIGRLKEQILRMQANGAAGLPLTTNAAAAGAKPMDQELATRIYDLERLLEQTIEREQSSNRDQERMMNRVKGMNELLDKREKVALALRMIVKLRDDRIARLRQTTDDTSLITSETQQELDSLRVIQANNPELIRLVLENADLRDRLDEFEENFGEKFDESRTQMVKLFLWADGLANQVKASNEEKRRMAEKLRRAETMQRSSPRRSLANDGPSGANVELEKWKAQMEFERQLAALQSQLNKATGDLSTYSRIASDKQVEMESDLVAAQREAKELDQALKASKLSHTSELERLRETIQSLRDAPAANAEDTARLAALEGELKAAQEEHAVMENKLAEADASVRSLSKEVARLENKARRMSEADQLKKQEDEQTLKEAERQLAAANDRLAQASAREADMARKIGEIEIELATVQEDCASATSAQAATEQARAALEMENGQQEQKLSAISKDFDSLTEEHRQLKEEHETLAEEAQFTTDSLASSQKVIQRMKKEIDDLKEAQLAAEAKADAHMSELEKVREQMRSGDSGAAKVAAENSELNAEVEALRAELTNLTGQLQGTTAARTEAEASVAALKAEGERAAVAFAELQKSLEALRASTESAQAESESLQGELAEARAAVTAAEAQVDERATAIATLQAELETAAREFDAAKAAHDTQLAGYLEEIKSRESKLGELQEERQSLVDAHTKTVDELNATIATLQRADEIEAAQHLAVVTAMKADAEAAAASHKATVESLTAAHAAEVTGLQAALEASRTDATSAQARFLELEARFKSTLTDLEGQSAVAVSENQKYAEAQLQISSQSSLIASLQKSVSEKEATVATYSTKLTAAEATIVERTKEVETLKEERTKLKTRERELVELYASADASRAEKNAEMASLNSQLQAANTRSKELTTQLSSTEGALKSAQAAAVAAQEARAQLEASLEERVQEVNDQLADAQADAAAKTAEVARLVNDNTRLKSSLEISLKAAEEAETRSKYLADSENYLFEENSKLTSQINKLEEDKRKNDESTQQKIADLSEQVNKLTGHQNQKQKIQHHIKIKEENNKLKEDKRDLTEEVAKQQKMIGKLNREITKLQGLIGKENLPDFDEEEALRQALSDRVEENKRMNDELQEERKRMNEELELLTSNLVSLAQTHADRTTANNLSHLAEMSTSLMHRHQANMANISARINTSGVKCNDSKQNDSHHDSSFFTGELSLQSA